MSLSLEVKMPATLFEGHPVGMDCKLKNEFEGYEPHEIAVQTLGDFVEEVPPEFLGKPNFDGVESFQLQLKPLTAVQNLNLNILLTNRIGSFLKEEHKAVIRCRIRKPVSDRGDMMVQIHGDFKAVIGYSEKEFNLIDWKKCNSTDDLIDLAYEKGRSAFTEIKWVSRRITPQRFQNSLGMSLIGVQAGSFQQGSTDEECDILRRKGMRVTDESFRNVTVDTPYWLSDTPVTQSQWMEIMGSRSSRYTEYEGDDFPVTCVSWHQANEFCRLLTEIEHEEKSLPEFLEYRLPTEAQWEYACKAGGVDQQYGDLRSIAVCDGQMKQVGKKLGNAWGFKDMLGNVNEWCRDTYVKHYSGAQLHDPFVEGGVEDAKVIRGGCYMEKKAEYRLRAALRQYAPPDSSSGRIGFRIALADRRQNLG